MAMEITSNYNSVYESTYTAQKQQTSKQQAASKMETKETANSSTSKSTAEYMSELAKLVPSVECRVGNTFASAKNGKTLTINPLLLEKMQNDPEMEKEMKELIKGVELAVNRLDSVMNASGWTVVFKHDYIDENGKYHQIALVRNDFMLNMSNKLREERRQNSEKFIEKSREKAAKKKEELQEKLEEKRIVKEDEKTASDKVEQLLDEKIAVSKDGSVYLYDTDIQTIIEAAKEDNADKADKKGQPAVGANLDLKV